MTDRQTSRYGNSALFFSELAAEGTYEFGKLVAFGNDDGKFKPMSGSQVLVAAGASLESKTVTAADVAAGERIRFFNGPMFLSNSSGGNAVTSADIGKLVYGDTGNSAFAVQDSAGTNPLTGRVVTLIDNAVVVNVDHTLFPSGTL
jgi:hypothetical protein